MINIEDDIKILKDKDCLWIYSEDDILKAQEHILAEREQDKARIKELEEENRMLALEGSRVRLDLYIKQNYIPKQKIKERFEKTQKLYEENLKQVDLKQVEKIDMKIFKGIKLEAERDLLRKLLQESEGK